VARQRKPLPPIGPAAPAPVEPAGPLVARVGVGDRGPTAQVERLTDVGLDQVERDVANGLTLVEVANRLGLSPETFRKVRKNRPEIDERILLGRARNEGGLVSRLMSIVRSPTTTDRDAAVTSMFLLKSRHGYRDQGPADGAATVTNIQQNIHLTTGDTRRRVAELLAQRERLLNGDVETIDAEVMDDGTDAEG